MYRDFYLVQNKLYIFYALIPFLVGLLGLILLTSFSEKLSSIDRGIASWAQSTTQGIDYYPYDTGLLWYINHKLDTQLIFPYLIYGLNLLIDILYYKLRSKAHIHFYLHGLLSFSLYAIFATSTKTILKGIFSRPRPLQTKEFAPYFTSSQDQNCLVDYCIGYVVCKVSNPCNLSLVSCPSGHTSNTASYWIGALYLSVYNYIYTRNYLDDQQKTQKRFNFIYSYIIIVTMALCTSIFIPSVMISRMSVLKHFFTDVTGGLCIAILWIPVMLLTQPRLTVKYDNQYHDLKNNDVMLS